MKKLFLLLALLIFEINVYSQNAVSSVKKSESFYILNKGNTASKASKWCDTASVTRFAVCTPKKDTLFILKDAMGDMTYTIWKEDPKYTGINPVIVRVENISIYEKKYVFSSNKKLKN